MTEPNKNESQTFHEACIHHSTPTIWLGRSWDALTGGFHNQPSWAGRALALPRRSIAQAAPRLGYATRSRGLVSLVKDRLFETPARGLLEFFNASCSACGQVDLAEVRKPERDFEPVDSRQTCDARLAKSLNYRSRPGVTLRGGTVVPRGSRCRNEPARDLSGHGLSHRFWLHMEGNHGNVAEGPASESVTLTLMDGMEGFFLKCSSVFISGRRG